MVYKYTYEGRHEGTDLTELEYECDECAEYIWMRLDNGEDLTEENLSMWMHDHFLKEL